MERTVEGHTRKLGLGAETRAVLGVPFPGEADDVAISIIGSGDF